MAMDERLLPEFADEYWVQRDDSSNIYSCAKSKI
jgi:hypothetical protein